MSTSRRVASAVAVIVAAAILTGCTTGSSDRGPDRRPSPTTTIVSSEPTPSAAGTLPAAPTPSATATPNAIPGEFVGWYPAQTPVDHGARTYAMGTVTLDEQGVPAAYLVASGDVIDYIAARFGLVSTNPSTEDYDYLNTINQVRRGGYPWSLYAGDTLNLSAHTITSVGDIDGVVRHDPAPDPMPAQR